ncbi:MAG: hypothetical protein WCA81_05720 [Rhizomicrobium sp.]
MAKELQDRKREPSRLQIALGSVYGIGMVLLVLLIPSIGPDLPSWGQGVLIAAFLGGLWILLHYFLGNVRRSKDS